MSDELTVEECEFAIMIKKHEIDYYEYITKICEDKIENWNNEIKVANTDMKVMKFRQKQGFHLDVNIDEYSKKLQKHIKHNRVCIDSEVANKVTISKQNILDLNQHILVLNQIVGSLLAKK